MNTVFRLGPISAWRMGSYWRSLYVHAFGVTVRFALLEHGPWLMVTRVRVLGGGDKP